VSYLQKSEGTYKLQASYHVIFLTFSMKKMSTKAEEYRKYHNNIQFLSCMLMAMGFFPYQMLVQLSLDISGG
jgi:hypothetical protein